ncbi:MAG: translation initiation factor IF-3 [Armatimonadota bacterium]
MDFISKDLKINRQIRAREVRIITEDGEQLGVMPIADALNMADERGYDLVEVSPNAAPPVCKLMDYGKYKYEQSKKEKEARSKQKFVKVKEIEMRPKIEEHDFQVKLKRILEFLKDGDKVKVSIFFRGREVVYKDLGRKIMDRVREAVADCGAFEKEPKMEGKRMFTIISSKS